jgi:hypothetical protein
LVLASLVSSARMPSTRAFISSSMRRTSACSMIDTRGAVGSFQFVMRALLAVLGVLERVEVRAASDTPRPGRRRDARAVHQVEHLRHAHVLGAADELADAASFSPKLSTQVAEPLMPILCSMAPDVHVVGSPSVPSSLTRTLGHDEEREALGAGRRAVDAREHEVDDVVGEVVIAPEM